MALGGRRGRGAASLAAEDERGGGALPLTQLCARARRRLADTATCSELQFGGPRSGAAVRGRSGTREAAALLEELGCGDEGAEASGDKGGGGASRGAPRGGG